MSPLPISVATNYQLYYSTPIVSPVQDCVATNLKNRLLCKTVKTSKYLVKLSFYYKVIKIVPKSLSCWLDNPSPAPRSLQSKGLSGGGGASGVWGFRGGVDRSETGVTGALLFSAFLLNDKCSMRSLLEARLIIESRRSSTPLKLFVRAV